MTDDVRAHAVRLLWTHSSMPSSSSLEVNDIIWELVKKTFSAWATVQQNIIVEKKIKKILNINIIIK